MSGQWRQLDGVRGLDCLRSSPFTRVAWGHAGGFLMRRPSGSKSPMTEVRDELSLGGIANI